MSESPGASSETVCVSYRVQPLDKHPFLCGQGAGLQRSPGVRGCWRWFSLPPLPCSPACLRGTPRCGPRLTTSARRSPPCSRRSPARSAPAGSSRCTTRYVSFRSTAPSTASMWSLQRQTRLSWSLLTVGVGLWATGQVGWSIIQVGLREVPSSPSFLDALFLSSPIFIVAGLLWMVRTPAAILAHPRRGRSVVLGKRLRASQLESDRPHDHLKPHPGSHPGDRTRLSLAGRCRARRGAVRRDSPRRRPPAGLALLGLALPGWRSQTPPSGI